MRIFLKILGLCAVIFVVLLGYIHRVDTQKIATEYIQGIRDIILPRPPCTEPIPYSIGSLDLRFKMSSAELIALLKEAEDLWEKPLDRDLFVYATSTRGTDIVTVNMLYDYRQIVTNKLNDLDTSIDTERARYNALKADFNRLTAMYEQKKRVYEQDVAKFDRESARYTELVDYWNTQGGAPQAEYDDLQKERVRLETESARINKNRTELNGLVTKINTDIAALNAAARKLNISVTNYNTTAQSTGEEFNEGEYIVDEDGININIYQFENRQKLLRVIAHEFGHTLNIDHVDNTEAIMYRLNSGDNVALTNDDIMALFEACELPTSEQTTP